jgi:hypothetical protein
MSKPKFKEGDRVVVKAMSKGSSWHDERKLFYDVPGTLVHLGEPHGKLGRIGFRYCEIQYDSPIGDYSIKTPFCVGPVRIAKA